MFFHIHKPCFPIVPGTSCRQINHGVMGSLKTNSTRGACVQLPSASKSRAPRSSSCVRSARLWRTALARARRNIGTVTTSRSARWSLKLAARSKNLMQNFDTVRIYCSCSSLKLYHVLATSTSRYAEYVHNLCFPYSIFYDAPVVVRFRCFSVGWE